MKRLWQRYVEKVDGVSLRERGMIFAAAAAVLIFVLDAVLIQPEFARQKRMSREVAQRQGEIKKMQEQLQQTALARQANPDQAIQRQLETLRKRIAETEAKLAEEQRRFVPPERIGALLDQMLSRNRRLQLVDMRTLPVANLADGSARSGHARQAGGARPPPSRRAKPAAPSAGSQIYRHGVEITLSGSYLDLLAYLQGSGEAAEPALLGQDRAQRGVASAGHAEALGLHAQPGSVMAGGMTKRVLCMAGGRDRRAAAGDSAEAQVLVDPTRPPASVAKPGCRGRGAGRNAVAKRADFEPPPARGHQRHHGRAGRHDRRGARGQDHRDGSGTEDGRGNRSPEDVPGHRKTAGQARVRPARRFQMKTTIAVAVVLLVSAGCAAPPPYTSSLDPAIVAELNKSGERKAVQPSAALEQALLPPLRVEMPPRADSRSIRASISTSTTRRPTRCSWRSSRARATACSCIPDVTRHRSRST